MGNGVLTREFKPTRWRDARAVLLAVAVSAGTASAGPGEIADPFADEQHLSIPGWEDVRIGESPPAEAKQVCKPLMKGSAAVECGGCRSAALPLPCIGVLVQAGKVSTIVASVPASLPKGDEAADVADARAMATVSAKWGKPTTARKEQMVETQCWDGMYEVATIVVSWMDIDPVKNVARRAFSPRARVLSITSQGPDGTCKPGTVSKGDANERAQVEADSPEAARVQKAEVAKKAERDRCFGENVLQVVVNLQLGRDLDPRKMRDCKYTVGFGRVQTTTRDGWMIVAWGTSQAAAFKTSKRRPDGAFLQKGIATYLGVRSFDRTDGGSTTIATFKLIE